MSRTHPRSGFKTVYFATDATEAIKRGAQNVHVTLIAHDAELGRRFRATISYDRSYSDQTHAEIDVLDGDHWSNLLHLHSSELRLIAQRDATTLARQDAPEQYDNQVWELINLGAHIIGRDLK